MTCKTSFYKNLLPRSLCVSWHSWELLERPPSRGYYLLSAPKRKYGSIQNVKVQFKAKYEAPLWNASIADCWITYLWNSPFLCFQSRHLSCFFVSIHRWNEKEKNMKRSCPRTEWIAMTKNCLLFIITKTSFAFSALFYHKCMIIRWASIVQSSPTPLSNLLLFRPSPPPFEVVIPSVFSSSYR